MSLLKEKNELKKQLYEEIDEIYKKINTLQKEIEPLLIQEMYDSGILKEAIWEISFSNNNVSIKSNCRKHEKLSDLLQKDHHCNIKIESGVIIYFDDWEITINFKSLSKFIDFVNKNEIKTDFNDFKQRRDQLKSEIKEIDDFIKKLSKLK